MRKNADWLEWRWSQHLERVVLEQDEAAAAVPVDEDLPLSAHRLAEFGDRALLADMQGSGIVGHDADHANPVADLGYPFHAITSLSKCGGNSRRSIRMGL